MRIGVVFPQTEIGADPAVIRAYAAAVEAIGWRPPTGAVAGDNVPEQTRIRVDRHVTKTMTGPLAKAFRGHGKSLLREAAAAGSEALAK